MRSIESDIRRFITENFLYCRSLEFAAKDSFLEMGLIDSTGILELVSFLEKHYQITIEDVDLIPENLDSISQLTDFVERKLRAGAQRVGAPLQPSPVQSMD